jgi:hypothetical protein
VTVGERSHSAERHALVDRKQRTETQAHKEAHFDSVGL